VCVWGGVEREVDERELETNLQRTKKRKLTPFPFSFFLSFFLRLLFLLSLYIALERIIILQVGIIGKKPAPASAKLLDILLSKRTGAASPSWDARTTAFYQNQISPLIGIPPRVNTEVISLGKFNDALSNLHLGPVHGSIITQIYAGGVLTYERICIIIYPG